MRLGHVALAVTEPGPPLSSALTRVVALDVCDPVDGLKIGPVVLLEDHSSRAQFGDRRLDVIHLPAHLGMLARGGAGRFEQRKLARGAHVPEAALPLFDGVEAKLLGVERPCPLEVLRWKPRRDSAFVQHLILHRS